MDIGDDFFFLLETVDISMFIFDALMGADHIAHDGGIAIGITSDIDGIDDRLHILFAQEERIDNSEREDDIP